MVSLVSEMYLNRFITLFGGRFSGVNKMPGQTVKIAYCA